jgi:hypothetical protein
LYHICGDISSLNLNGFPWKIFPLSSPCVERSSWPDIVTLGGREVGPIFGNGLGADDCSIQVDPKIRHEPLLEKRRRPIVPSRRLSTLNAGEFLGMAIGRDNDEGGAF